VNPEAEELIHVMRRLSGNLGQLARCDAVGERLKPILDLLHISPLSALIPRSPCPEDAGVRLKSFNAMVFAYIDFDHPIRPGKTFNRSHGNYMLLYCQLVSVAGLRLLKLHRVSLPNRARDRHRQHRSGSNSHENA
jgi:hypothetical protein